MRNGQAQTVDDDADSVSVGEHDGALSIKLTVGCLVMPLVPNPA